MDAGRVTRAQFDASAARRPALRAVCMALFEQRGQICGRQCFTDEKALNLIAVMGAQEVELGLRFDPFGDNTEPHAVRHRDHRAHHRCVIRIGVEILYERAIACTGAQQFRAPFDRSHGGGHFAAPQPAQRDPQPRTGWNMGRICEVLMALQPRLVLEAGKQALREAPGVVTGLDGEDPFGGAGTLQGHRQGQQLAIVLPYSRAAFLVYYSAYRVHYSGYRPAACAVAPMPP